MDKSGKAYWMAVLTLVAQVLVVWFLVSYGAGILFASALNSIMVGGYPLGFWFAQQGSIFTFLVLIFYYAFRMNRLDRQYGVNED